MTHYRNTPGLSPADIALVLSSTRPAAHRPLAMAQWQDDVLAVARAIPEKARESFLVSCRWYPKQLSPLVREGVVCPTCHGDRFTFKPKRRTCSTCRGEGIVPESPKC